MNLNDKQMLALRCACADLIGAMQARNQNDVEVHDWKAHSLTIDELIEAFDFLSEFSRAANTANAAYETTFGEFASNT